MLVRSLRWLTIFIRLAATVPSGIVLRILLFTFLLTFSYLWGTPPKEISVGVYENEPKIFTQKTGEPAGIFIDIIEYIAKQENWKINYVRCTWDEGLEKLSKGELDLMPDVAYTSQRDLEFSFHKVSVLSSWSQVFARKGSGIRSILDLNNKRVGVLAGSMQEKVFEGLTKGFGLNTALITFPTYELAFAAVTTGKVDAAVTNNYFGLLHARKLGLEDTAIVFNPATLFFAAPPGVDQQMLNRIDEHLMKLKQDSQSVYYDSIKHWTSDRVALLFPLWLKLVGIFVAVAFAVSLVAVYQFKRLVNLRTRELRKSNLEMEEKIIARTWDLEAAMEKAKDADQIKSAFLATMSHELRTPLNSIIGFTGILLQELAGDLNAEQKKQLSMVQNSSRHLLSLINDVLDISKIEAGQLVLAFDSFDLAKSIDKVVKIMHPLAEKKGLDIGVTIEGGVSAIYGDQRHVEQILLNLISNSVKFTEHGQIKLSCLVRSGICTLSVADTGIGMQQEEIGRLFLPFSQIDTGLTRKYEGTGLGLSICKKLIELMKGTISVESEYGKGSTFRIVFPVTKEELM